MLESSQSEELTVHKSSPQRSTRLSSSKKTPLTIRSRDGKILAYLSDVDAVIERHATKSLADKVLAQSATAKHRSVRAPHLPNVERELAELRKVVAALAVRSAAHEEAPHDFDIEGMTVLDAETAYAMLDNPPEPTEELRKLLALR